MTNSEILKTMKLLGIKEITTPRQARNGTRKFKLPMKWYSKLNSEYSYDIVLSSYASGYVRKSCWKHYFSGNLTEYQVNKVKRIAPNTKGNHYEMYERILIPKELDRLEYLVKFAVKNYYIKPIEKTRVEEKRVLQDISVSIDGQRHTLQSAEELDFSKLEADRFYKENKDRFDLDIID